MCTRPGKIEKAAEIDLGIEQIVVVSHDTVAPEGGVELQLEGADAVPFGAGLDNAPGIEIAAPEQVVERVVDAAEMPLRIGTTVRVTLPIAVALRVSAETDFVLGRQDDGAQPQPLSGHVFAGIHGGPGG